jgi:hypothetical protein
MRIFNVPVTISRWRNHRKARGARKRKDGKLLNATILFAVRSIFTIDTKLLKFEDHLQVLYIILKSSVPTSQKT